MDSLENETGGSRRGAAAELARLLPYARRHAMLLASTLAASVSLAVVDVPVPFFLKKVIDSALGGRHAVPWLGRELAARPLLLAIFASLLALALFKAFLLYAQRIASETLGQRMIFELRADLYRHLQSLSLSFFQRARTGRLMLRLVGDINAVLDMITDGFLRAAMDVLTITTVAAVLFVLHWQLAGIVLAGLPIYVLALARLSPRLRESGRLARRERSELSGILQEKIAGAAVVKAFRQEDAERARLEEQTGRLRDRLIDKARIGGRLQAIAHLAVALGGALVLWIGGTAVLDGRMTKGGLMAFYALAAMLFPPMRRLARTNEVYQAARVSLERILDFLDGTETLRESEGARPLEVSRGEVRFEGVRFAYVEGPPVLDGIDLALAPGEVVALVGPNGAGKSTLASLVPRFIDPDTGRVTIDGMDLRHATLESLRRQVGIVAQETFLFSGSVEENIRYGRPDAALDDVLAAARAAGALEFIEGLPEGFATDVGERGRRLSGGQAQRIALARIALMNPKILILDEATSAVDAESESVIHDALTRLTAGRTTLVIAHRASTVRRADRIVVLERGRIVENGNPAEVFRRGGALARLLQSDPIVSSAAV